MNRFRVPLRWYLVIVSLPSCRLGRDRRPLFRQQLLGGLVETDHRALWVIGFRVKVQHILHTRHKLAHLGLPRQTACEFPRGWRAPAPTPMPGAAGSSGHGLEGPRCTPGQSGALPPAHPVWSDVLAEDLPPRPASVLPPGTAAWYGTPYPQTCPAPPRCASPPSPYLPLAEYGLGQPFALGSFPRESVVPTGLVLPFPTGPHTVLVPWLPPSYVNTPKKG